MTRDADDDAEESDDARAYRLQLLNGDARFNKFVELTDMRFASQARRTNKRAKELRDEMRTLRSELAPVVELAHTLAAAKRWAPIVGTVIGGVASFLFVLFQLGVIP